MRTEYLDQISQKFQQYQGYLAGGLGSILIVLTAWYAANLTWQLFTPAQQYVSQPASGGAGGSVEEVQLENLQQLHLFGELGADPAAAQSRTEAPETQLNLRLIGVTASNNPERSAAVIQQGSEQRTYIPGEQIARSRAVLEEILPDRVLLNNEGQRETLYLEGRDGYEAVLTVPQIDAATGPVAGESEVAEEATEIPDQLASDIEDIRDNPEAINELIQISPARGPEGLQGYRLEPRDNPEAFAEAGFQPGDVAVAINGFDLTDMTEAMQIMNELDDLQQISVRVLRDGEYVDLQLRVPTQ